MAPGAGKKPAAKRDFFSVYGCIIQSCTENWRSATREEAMLSGDMEEHFNAFYHAAYADGEVDGKTKVLIGMAVAMAVSGGRVRAQAREALKGMLEPLSVK